MNKIKDNIDADIDEDMLEDKVTIPSIDKLCITRCTVRGKAFEQIILNHDSLMEICLQESLSTDVKARIIGYQKQMSSFPFLFGLCLGHKLFLITDNLSKTLQNEKMSAVRSQKCANLTSKTFKGMRNKEISDIFFNCVEERLKYIL